MNDLARKTIGGFTQLTIGLGVLLFVPAWTFDFWQAWFYLIVFAGSSALITAYLWQHDPKLLERRVAAGPGAEKETSQKAIQVLASLAFVSVLIVPSLDRRFSWSEVPFVIVVAGDIFVALGFLVVFVVFRENSFTAATIEVAAHQNVVSTGPYSLVRHPMYLGALVMLFGTPLALASWWGLLTLVPMTLVISWRLLDEERFLSKNLPGYAAYAQRVRHRLLPRIW
ncbi:MAG: isoprenylcysteine carboxylmethyltransferase family protein [Candidatus Baltobacteraceae bacterium]